jgi:hypothetical protein
MDGHKSCCRVHKTKRNLRKIEIKKALDCQGCGKGLSKAIKSVERRIWRLIGKPDNKTEAENT